MRHTVSYPAWHIAEETPLAEPTPELPPATPGWVKAMAVIGLVALVAIVVVLLLGGHAPPVQHGP